MAESGTGRGPGSCWCLRRRGGREERLRLEEGTEVTIGRGIGVTYQLTSTLCPLMISRTHCILKQNAQGHWTVTDNKSLNGVWLDKERLDPGKAHVLSAGSCIQLGVPLPDTEQAEFEYELLQEDRERVRPFLSRPLSGKTKGPRTKRKLNSEDSEASGTEGPSNSSKAKVHRVARDCEEPTKSSHRTDLAKQPTVMVEAAAPLDQPDGNVSMQDDAIAPTQQQCRSTLQLTMVRQTMLEIRKLKVRVQEKQTEMLSATQQSKARDATEMQAVHKELQELQDQLSNEREEQLQRVEELKQIFQEEQQKQGERKLAEEEPLKEQLAQALQEHTLLMEELNRNKDNFEQIIQAKNKELQETKEEQEKVRAQKEEVLNHMNDVLDNELQCIICSEHFIEAVTLNCAHSFCSYCIQAWKKRKEECPICRQEIRSQTRSLVLDNCIDSMVNKLSPEMKARRESLIVERKDMRQAEEVIPVTSDSDSSSLPSDAVFISSSSSDSEEMDDEFGMEYGGDDYWPEFDGERYHEFESDEDEDEDDNFFIF